MDRRELIESPDPGLLLGALLLLTSSAVRTGPCLPTVWTTFLLLCFQYSRMFCSVLSCRSNNLSSLSSSVFLSCLFNDTVALFSLPSMSRSMRSTLSWLVRCLLCLASIKRWSRFLARANNFSSAIRPASMTGGGGVREACRADSARGLRVPVMLLVWVVLVVRATTCSVRWTVPSLARSLRRGGAVRGD